MVHIIVDIISYCIMLWKPNLVIRVTKFDFVLLSIQVFSAVSAVRTITTARAHQAVLAGLATASLCPQSCVH